MVLIFPGRFVLKVPALRSWKAFLTGLLANLQEKAFSSTGWPELCPVTLGCPLGFWLVMPYARPLTQEEWIDLDYSAFVNRADYCIPAEEKICSFGVLNGQIVAIDYGS